MSRKANPKEHASGLTLKGQLAVEHYLEHQNKVDAYVHAFGRGRCAPATLKAKAMRFFAGRPVVAEIKRRRDALSRRTDVTVDDIVNRLRQIGMTDMPGIVHWDGRVMRVEEFGNLSADQRAAIESLEFQADVTADVMDALLDDPPAGLGTVTEFAKSREFGDSPRSREFGDSSDSPVNGDTPAGALNVKLGGVKVKVKMKDNLGALKMLGQYLGMFEKKQKSALSDTPMIQLFMPK